MNAATAPVRRTLEQWLTWQETLHPRAIDMGLERVRRVADTLGLLPFPAFCINIAGTNGKGSCAHMLAHILKSEQSVGVYTSPYLLRYNERVNINGEDVSDADLCMAFEAVELARSATSLTYFEFGTLAVLWLFREYKVDIAVLEVGMGGRLDAVNIIDADIALITSIGLDHTDWLGDTREAIGAEKAGIMRPGQTVICADRDPPASIQQAARETGASLKTIVKDFDLSADGSQWRWQDWQDNTAVLPACPHLLMDNVAAVLAALTAMQRLSVAKTVGEQLVNFSVPGRRQVIDGVKDGVQLVLDVAHNLEAMQVLVKWLAEHPIEGEDHIVLGMLRNKPVEAVGELLESAGRLYAGGLADGSKSMPGRGLSGADLAARLGTDAQVFADVEQAFEQARANAGHGDRIVVCGSFYTLAAVLAFEFEGSN